MESKIRKIVREQIKTLKEYGNLNSPRHRSRARDFSVSPPSTDENPPEHANQEYYMYLNNLRDSGKINMMGAAPYLAKAFNIDKREARKIGRNEKVTITQGNESKVIKYKKAQPLLEDGWTLSEQ